MSSIVDLTHSFNDRISLYPGTPKPVFETVHTIAEHGYAEKRFQLHSHMGTHMDAPGHIIEGGLLLDKMPVASFIGTGVAIDCRQSSDQIDLHTLLRYEAEIRESSFVLLNTGWSRYWGKPEYIKGFPTPSRECCEWLARMNIKGLGIDALSPDPVNSTDYNNHNILLRSGILIIENLNNLEILIGKSFQFLCLPLLLENSDGAPARAAAITA